MNQQNSKCKKKIVSKIDWLINPLINKKKD